jgi:hypothetical protein
VTTNFEEKRCPKGHLVKFGNSEGGLVTCTCPGCAKQTGVIYRGHGLEKDEAFRNYLSACIYW